MSVAFLWHVRVGVHFAYIRILSSPLNKSQRSEAQSVYFTTQTSTGALAGRRRELGIVGRGPCSMEISEARGNFKERSLALALP